MSRRRHQPWANGPADIVLFPRVPVRSWFVAEMAPGDWRAEIVGEPVEWEWQPITGNWHNVLRRIADHNRDPWMKTCGGCGLPVVFEWRMSTWAETVRAMR